MSIATIYTSWIYIYIYILAGVEINFGLYKQLDQTKHGYPRKLSPFQKLFWCEVSCRFSLTVFIPASQRIHKHFVCGS